MPPMRRHLPLSLRPDFGSFPGLSDPGRRNDKSCTPLPGLLGQLSALKRDYVDGR
jgi:hypothetical protein